jgi:hypothetical protein
MEGMWIIGCSIWGRISLIDFGAVSVNFFCGLLGNAQNQTARP